MFIELKLARNRIPITYNIMLLPFSLPNYMLLLRKNIYFLFKYSQFNFKLLDIIIIKINQFNVFLKSCIQFESFYICFDEAKETI